MFLKFLKLNLLFLFLSFTVLRAEVIDEISVLGNKRISKETIQVLGNIDKEKDFGNKEINIILKNLYETDFFEDIAIKIEGKTLIITVKENPIINTIVFDGEDAKKYREKIEEIITLREKSSFIRNWW